jgi:hypothetical protein
MLPLNIFLGGYVKISSISFVLQTLIFGILFDALSSVQSIEFEYANAQAINSVSFKSIFSQRVLASGIYSFKVLFLMRTILHRKN